MNGIKEFNQKVFELFYLYRRRTTLMADGFARALPFSEANVYARPNPRGSKSISVKSINYEIRLREKVFFHNFAGDGFYPDHPFVKLCGQFSLNRIEQKMMVCLLGQALKDYMLRDSLAGSKNPSQESQLISLIFPNPGLAFARTGLFSAESRLVKSGLIEIKQCCRDKFCGEFALDPEAVKWLLGFCKQEPPMFSNPAAAKNDSAELLEIEQPSFSLEKVVLSQNLRDQIQQAIYFYKEPESQNLLPKLGNVRNGQAILALFYGPPGTGKTYTASAIAGELKKPLARVQFAALRNMWYGNSEKNVVRCFRTASAKNMVLLFDEADALISARTKEKNQATDNTEHTLRNLFLQEIERFNGVVILTTNMAECLDPALERRLNLKLEFTLPEIQERERLWKKFLKKAPCDRNLNLQELAEMPLAGGHIKNAVFAALRNLAYLRKDHPDAIITQSLLLASALKESQFLEFKDRNRIVGFSN